MLRTNGHEVSPVHMNTSCFNFILHTVSILYCSVYTVYPIMYNAILLYTTIFVLHAVCEELSCIFLIFIQHIIMSNELVIHLKGNIGAKPN